MVNRISMAGVALVLVLGVIPAYAGHGHVKVRYSSPVVARHVCTYAHVPVTRSYYDHCGRLVRYTVTERVRTCRHEVVYAPPPVRVYATPKVAHPKRSSGPAYKRYRSPAPPRHYSYRRY